MFISRSAIFMERSVLTSLTIRTNEWSIQVNRPSRDYQKLNSFKLWLMVLCSTSKTFFSSFHWREPTTWPANNCLQIMVCSCVIPSKCVLLQIIFCSCVIVTTLLYQKWQIAPLSCQSDLNMKTNLVIEWWNNYWIRLSQNIVIYQCPADQLFASAFGFGNNWSARHCQISIFCSNLVQ